MQWTSQKKNFTFVASAKMSFLNLKSAPNVILFTVKNASKNHDTRELSLAQRNATIIKSWICTVSSKTYWTTKFLNVILKTARRSLFLIWKLLSTSNSASLQQQNAHMDVAPRFWILSWQHMMLSAQRKSKSVKNVNSVPLLTLNHLITIAFKS